MQTIIEIKLQQKFLLDTDANNPVTIHTPLKQSRHPRCVEHLYPYIPATSAPTSSTVNTALSSSNKKLSSS